MTLFGQSIASNVNAVINAQCDTQAIEAGTKIRGARRDANGNLLHSETECSDAPLQRQPIRKAMANRKYARKYG